MPVPVAASSKPDRVLGSSRCISCFYYNINSVALLLQIQWATTIELTHPSWDGRPWLEISGPAIRYITIVPIAHLPTLLELGN